MDSWRQKVERCAKPSSTRFDVIDLNQRECCELLAAIEELREDRDNWREEAGADRLKRLGGERALLAIISAVSEWFAGDVPDGLRSDYRVRLAYETAPQGAEFDPDELENARLPGMGA